MRSKLTDNFKQKLAQTGLNTLGIARALGIPEQKVKDVLDGNEPPTMALLTGAVQAGLADNFGQVAEPNYQEQAKKAA